MLEQNLRVPELSRIVFEGLVERPSTLAQHRLTSDYLRATSIEMIGNRLSDFRDGANATYHRIPRHWEDLKREFYFLVCTDDPRYAAGRALLGNGAGKSQREIAAIIAATIAPMVKTADMVLLPFCALCLIALVKLGRTPFAAMELLQTDIGAPENAAPASGPAPAELPKFRPETLTAEQVKIWAAALVGVVGERRGPERLSDAEYFRIMGRVRGQKG